MMNLSSLFPFGRAWLAAIALCTVSPAISNASAQISEGSTAPTWALRDLSGKAVTSDEFKGNIVILDFWATWCPPCRAEIPGFVDLYKRYAEKGLVIVGVSLDQKGPAAVKPFMDKFRMNYPVAMGDEQIVKAFGGIEALPTTFVIDRTGKIVRVHIGFADAETFEKDIKSLL